VMPLTTCRTMSSKDKPTTNSKCANRVSLTKTKCISKINFNTRWPT
jgi:hypothetical protein